MKKTNNKRITLGIGMALAVLVALTTTAAATGEYFYLVEKDSNCTGDACTRTVWVMVHTSEDNVGSAQIHLEFDPEVVNITDISAPTDPVWHMWDWKHEGDYVFAIGVHFVGVGPGELQVAELTVECQKAGVSTLNFTHVYPMTPDPTAIADVDGINLPATSINGTFGCEAPPAPPALFEKELVSGWNLISLPLKPDDNNTSVVLSSMSGNYSTVFRYDATAKQFEDVTDGTMDPGIGYFVNVMTAGTWSYMGRCTSISVDLKPGLNCIGWGNASVDISDALSPISGNYNYVARWDADDPKYEVYDANAPEGVSEFIDFTTMERGTGYWIAAKEDCTLNVG